MLYKVHFLSFHIRECRAGRLTTRGEQRTALYAAAPGSQSTRNNNPMAEMDDTGHAFLKRSLFLNPIESITREGGGGKAK